MEPGRPTRTPRTHFTARGPALGITHAAPSIAFVVNASGVYHIAYTAYLDSGLRGSNPQSLIVSVDGVNVPGSTSTIAAPNLTLTSTRMNQHHEVLATLSAGQTVQLRNVSGMTVNVLNPSLVLPRVA